MTRQEWLDEAERYQQKIDETEDESTRELYERKRDACQYAAQQAADEDN